MRVKELVRRLAKTVIHAKKLCTEGKITLSAAQFRAWMDRMGFKTSIEAALALGVTRNTISAYRSKGADERIKLACRSLADDAAKIKAIKVYDWEGVE